VAAAAGLRTELGVTATELAAVFAKVDQQAAQEAANAALIKELRSGSADKLQARLLGLNPKLCLEYLGPLPGPQKSPRSCWPPSLDISGPPACRTQGIGASCCLPREAAAEEVLDGSKLGGRAGNQCSEVPEFVDGYTKLFEECLHGSRRPSRLKLGRELHTFCSHVHPQIARQP
jgi:hypothetical protein